MSLYYGPGWIPVTRTQELVMSRTSVIERLLAAKSQNTLTTFTVPGSDLVLSIDSNMLNKAIAAWGEIKDRQTAIASVRRAMRRAVKKHDKGQLTQLESNAFASDCALWFAYETLYGDPRKYVADPPDVATLKRSAI